MIIIYDVSAIIYAGALARYSSNWHKNFFPTGGLYKLFGYILKDLKNLQLDTYQTDRDLKNNKNNLILCFDSVKNYRKQVYPEYKANRSANKSDLDRKKVSSQIKAAKLICEELNIPFVEKEGYEADDLIYSIVKQNPNEDIMVRADDSDLRGVGIYNKNVRFESVSGKNNSVADPRILGTKIAFGDSSDNIPPIAQAYRQQIVQLYNKSPLYFLNPKLSVEELEKYLPKTVAQELYRNCFLVSPKIIEDLGIPKYKPIDRNMLMDIMNVFAFKKYLKMYLKENRDYTMTNKYDFSVKLMNLLDSEVKNYFLAKEEKLKWVNEKDKTISENKDNTSMEYSKDNIRGVDNLNQILKEFEVNN